MKQNASQKALLMNEKHVHFKNSYEKISNEIRNLKCSQQEKL